MQRKKFNMVYFYKTNVNLNLNIEISCSGLITKVFDIKRNYLILYQIVHVTAGRFWVEDFTANYKNI